MVAHPIHRQDVGSRDRRGRRARWPNQIPWRGWWDILLRVKDDLANTNASLIAAGLAFYAFLGIPSAFSALVALYGLVFDPTDVQQQVEGMKGVMPDEAITLISSQLQAITTSSHSKLGVALGVSVLVALWSARSGMSSLMTAMNIAYAETERRGFLAFEAAAFVMTAGATLFAIVAIALVAVLPAVIDLLPLGEFGKTVASVVRWPVLLVLTVVGLAMLYRVGPSRERSKWRWVSTGAVVASALWLIGSALFSIYVADFAAYDKTYGSLGGVVVLLMWLYVSFFVVLLGAELNAEIEHQTARDSTTGKPQPMGERGAVMADTLGERR